MLKLVGELAGCDPFLPSLGKVPLVEDSREVEGGDGLGVDEGEIGELGVVVMAEVRADEVPLTGLPVVVIFVIGIKVVGAVTGVSVVGPLEPPPLIGVDAPPEAPPLLIGPEVG